MTERDKRGCPSVNADWDVIEAVGSSGLVEDPASPNRFPRKTLPDLR
jgi:hypothetical protein